MSSDAEFLEKLAAALDKLQIDAVVVGNAGAILRGAPVLTQDVDLFLRDTPENRRKLVDLARRIGGSAPAPVDETHEVLRIRADVMVDALFWIGEGLSFGQVRARSRRVTVGRRQITVASLRDIIRSKEVAGRPKDLASLPILRSTLRAEAAAQKLERRLHRYGADRKHDPPEEGESPEE